VTAEEIELLKEGDEKTFTLLIDRYADRVLKLAGTFFFNKEDAEDVTQEVFTAVFLTVYDFRGQAKFSTWIHRITINKCQEKLRYANRKKRMAKVKSFFLGDTQPVDEVQGKCMLPEAEYNKKEMVLQMKRVLDQLPINQRTAFILFYVKGFSYQEVSELMELSSSAIESLLFRARKEVRKKVAPYLTEDLG
jgi:RNA polymerase sigma-70 factor (ECF subfamily)